MKTAKEITQELCRLWNISELVLRADCYEQANGKKAFRNIRTPNGVRCQIPGKANFTLFEPRFQTEYELGKEYELKLFVAPDSKRAEKEDPYLLFIDTRFHPPKIIEVPAKNKIEEIAQTYMETRGEALTSLVGAMKRLSAETNKKPETFIYELIQNADDYPGDKQGRVGMTFRIKGDYLVVIHNGQVFSPANVSAICTVDGGDKGEDIQKTGYKGIGFKSIFKDCGYAWIESGDFSFRFDEAAISRNGENRPWQVIPIWTDPRIDVSPEIRKGELPDAPVKISLRPRKGRAKLLEYESIFQSVFRNDRVLLFLRHVRSIRFLGDSVDFSISKSESAWCFGSSGDIRPDHAIIDALNKAVLIDDRVPEKYKDLQATTIQYATVRDGDRVLATPAASLHAYLPTSVNLGLPFLINGDFIPDGSRDNLFSDVELNKYLMRMAGKYFPKWLGELYKTYQDTGMYAELVPDFDQLQKQNQHNPDQLLFLNEFKAGMEEGLEEFACFPTQTGGLKKRSELLVDKTGISGIMPASHLHAIGKTGELIHHELVSVPGIKLLFKDREDQLFTKEDLPALLQTEGAQKWLSDPEHNYILLFVLLAKKWLGDLKEVPIYLDQVGELQSQNYLFYSFGDDHELLQWRDFPCLHPVVREKLEGRNPDLVEYEAKPFITRFILGMDGVSKNPDLTSIAHERVKDQTNNLRFWSYLQKHAALLTDREFKGLKEYGVFTHTGEYIPLSESMFFFHEEGALRVESTGAIPFDSFHVLSPAYSVQGSTEEHRFWDKIGIRRYQYDDSGLFKELIIDDLPEIQAAFLENDHFDTAEARLAANRIFWQEVEAFRKEILTKNWQAYKAQLATLPICTTTGEYVGLGDSFLSERFTGNTTLENLAEQTEGEEYFFVSGEYPDQSSLSSEEWARLFKSCGIQTSEQEFLDVLLSRLEEIDAEDLVSRTAFLFKYRSKIEDLPSMLSDLQVLDMEGNVVAVEDLYLGPDYGGVNPESILPSVSMTQYISPDYLSQSRGSARDWASFFEELGAKELTTEEALLAVKLEILEESWEEFETEEASVKLLRELMVLDQRNLLNDVYGFLSDMPLGTCAKGEFREAGWLFLSSSYAPKIDIEASLSGEHKDQFVSDMYQKELQPGFPKLSDFLKKIGVSDRWKINSIPEIHRGNIPEQWNSYLAHIDSGGYFHSMYLPNKRQHGILNFNFPYWQNAFTKFDLSLLFWRTASNGDLKKITKETRYWVRSNKDKNTYIPSPFQWFMMSNPSIPGSDQQCHYASELYSHSLKPILGDSVLYPAIDFRNRILDKEEGTTLEDWLGIRQELDLGQCLNRVTQLQNDKSLRKEGIWDRIEQLCEPDEDHEHWTAEELQAWEHFQDTGMLPTQTGDWKPVNEIRVITDDFNLGVQNSPWFLRKGLEFLHEQLAFSEITRDDFHADYLEKRPSKGLVDNFENKAGYIALLVNPSGWQEEKEGLIKRFQSFEFFQVKKIVFTLTEKLDPPISKSDRLFHTENDQVFHVGDWNQLRAKELIDFVYRDVLQLSASKLSMDLLLNVLLWRVEEICEYCTDKGIQIPVELQVATNPPIISTSKAEYQPAEPPISRGRETPVVSHRKRSPERVVSNGGILDDLSDREREYLEDLFDNEVPKELWKNLNLAALITGLQRLREIGYEVKRAEDRLADTHHQALLAPVIEPSTGRHLTVMCRSAKNGILYLNKMGWSELEKEDVCLFVKTGNLSTDYKLLWTKEEILRDESAQYRILRLESEEKLAELDRLLDQAEAADSLRIILRMREGTAYDSIFEKIGDKESQEDNSSPLTGFDDEY